MEFSSVEEAKIIKQAEHGNLFDVLVKWSEADSVAYTCIPFLEVIVLQSSQFKIWPKVLKITSKGEKFWVKFQNRTLTTKNEFLLRRHRKQIERT